MTEAPQSETTGADRVVRLALGVGALVVIGIVAWAGVARYLDEEGSDSGGRGRGGAPKPAAVLVAPITTGAISEQLLVSGSTEAPATVVVTPKVGGRLTAVQVDIGDRVERGAVVATIDDRDYQIAVTQAEAAVKVAIAHQGEVASRLGIARKEAQRQLALLERGVASPADAERAQADVEAIEAAVAVAAAECHQAEVALSEAKLRLQDTAVTATWDGDDTTRVVAERMVDPGELVVANRPLMEVMAIDPLVGVLHVTEADYGRIAVGQAVTLQCDALPERRFMATVNRIAPKFNQASRQARVELTVPNADGALKPGMFVRAAIELDRVEAATLVPVAALVSRDGAPAVFVVNAEGSSVARVPVQVGLRGDGVVQVSGEGLSGRVVVLGQQLLDDGSPITIPSDASSPADAGAADESQATATEAGGNGP